MSLYGFAAREEQEMFEKLLLVNGVGPKGALGFLSVLNPSEIVMAILSDDVKTLSKAPGVGNDVPDGDGTFKILYRAYERGLLIISLSENILRVQPPLNIRPENLKKGFAILKDSIRDYVNGDIPDSVMEFRAGW